MKRTPILAFANNKGGVGKTTLVYHTAWMFADLGLRVLAADLDPQANLTAAFLDEGRVEEIWDRDQTIFGAISPVLRGIGDVSDPHLEIPAPADELALVCGDIRLSSFEDALSKRWPEAMDGDEAAFRTLSAFWRVLRAGAEAHEADIVLMDLGPNLGAINRSALIATDHIVLPLSPDLFSLQGLKNLGPTIRQWRKAWSDRLDRQPPRLDIGLPEAGMQPAGYVVLQHSIRFDRPVRAYEKWIARIPEVYWEDVLDIQQSSYPAIQDDPHLIALLKHYRSLMPMAQEARKPIFRLKAADGARGSHFAAVQAARDDFEQLARQIAERIGLDLPAPYIPSSADGP